MYMYWLLLKCVRSTRRVKRRLLQSSSPQSNAIAGEVERALLTKLSSVFEHINLLQLGYLFIAMFFASNHYCRRLPQIIKGKHPFLPGVDRVVVLAAGALAIEALFLGIGLDHKDALIVIVATGLSAPLWAPILSGCIAACLLVFGKYLKWLAVHTGILAFRSDYVSVVLWFETYRRLNRSVLRWAMFNYIAYLLIAGPVAASLIVQFKDFPFSSPVFLLVLVAVYILIVKPYIEILRGSLIVPLPETYSADFANLESAIRRATPPEVFGPASGTLIRDVRLQTGIFIGTMKVLERRATKRKLLHAFLAERSNYARDLITQGLMQILDNRQYYELLETREQILASFRRIVDKQELAS
jgi:hypothetical protein